MNGATSHTAGKTVNWLEDWRKSSLFRQINDCSFFLTCRRHTTRKRILKNRLKHHQYETMDGLNTCAKDHWNKTPLAMIPNWLDFQKTRLPQIFKSSGQSAFGQTFGGVIVNGPLWSNDIVVTVLKKPPVKDRPSKEKFWTKRRQIFLVLLQLCKRTISSLFTSNRIRDKCGDKSHFPAGLCFLVTSAESRLCVCTTPDRIK